MKETYLAFDLGAESGRAVAGTFDDGRLSIEELHRFPNRPGRMRKTLFWDFPALLSEIKEGLVAFSRKFDRPPAGISCDSWGVDFGLLDARGDLLGNPVHYRDSRTVGMDERVFSRVSKEDLYRCTGTQYMPLNTLFQIESLVASASPQWEAAERFLHMADLVNYFLSGSQVVESSLASTSHLYDALKRTWAIDLIRRLAYAEKKFPEIVPSGTRVGTLDEEIVSDLGLPASYRNTPIIAALSHDTAAAVAAVPADPATRWAYLSSGTWSLLGLELEEPILTNEVLGENFTNEGGAEGTVRFLKNIMGLWILQECRRVWESERGEELDYATLATLAVESGPSQSFIDPDYPEFLPPGDMPKRIRDYCRRTGQPIPQDIGAVARVVLESLSLKYRHNLEVLERLTGGVKIEVLHIVGGGGKNRFLNQTVADVLGIPVVVGPTEATAAGNLVTQAVAMNKVGGLWEGRKIVAASLPIERFDPDPRRDWDSVYRKYLSLVS